MAILAYKNRLNTLATWADNGSAFATLPPIQNMGTRQVPAPYAEFEGAAADFTVTPAASFDVRVLALLGHNLQDGAIVTFKNQSGVTLGSAETVARFKNRPNNTFVVLSAAQSVSAIQVTVSGASTGTNRIAAAWASPGWEFSLLRDTRYRSRSSGRITRIDGTDWVDEEQRRRVFPGKARGSQKEILGFDIDGNALAGDDAETVMEDAKHYGAVILIPNTASSAAIHSSAIYGALDTAGSPEHVSGDIWQMGFTVAESR